MSTCSHLFSRVLPWCSGHVEKIVERADERARPHTRPDVIIDLSLKPHKGVAIAPQFHDESIVDRCKEGLTVVAAKTAFAT